MCKTVTKTLCRMCDDHCGIKVTSEDNKVIHIEGNEDFVWNRGRVCIKADAGVHLNNHPERILKPLKKVDGKFVEISLDQALNEIAAKIKELQAEHGTETVSVWKGEAIGFSQQEEIYRRFIHAIDSPNYFSNDTQCFAGRWIGYSLVYGRWNSQPDFENSKCIVVWGANPPAAHPNMMQQINRARDKGAKLIVVDVRESFIARQADIFAQIKPGTDGALAWGLINTLITKDMYSKEFIENFSKGFDEVRDYAKTFTTEFVAQEIGLSLEETEVLLTTIAQTMWQSNPAVINYIGNGFEHHVNGINNIRAVAYFDALLNAVDAKGGNYSPVGFPTRGLCIYDEKPLEDKRPIGKEEFPVLYDFRQECHTNLAMDTILSGKPYPLTAMIVAGANPVMTNANSAKVKAAMDKLELLVVRELFMTETAESAHYILPAATYLERSELHAHGGFQTISLTKKAVLPAEGVQNEYEFLHALAHRLGAGEFFPWENEDKLNEWLVADTGVSLETIAAAEDGYNWGEKVFHKHEAKAANGEKPFGTPSGKFEFSSEYLAKLGYQSIGEYVSPSYITQPEEEFSFVLVTGARKVPYYHSRNHNMAHLSSAMPAPDVEMHPEDAAALGLQTGDMAVVRSKIGEITIPVTVMEAHQIKKGSLQIYHGWAEANVNLLTHDDIHDPIDGFPLMKSIPVHVSKVN